MDGLIIFCLSVLVPASLWLAWRLLAPQINIGLSGQALKVTENEVLVIISLALENRGVRHARIQAMSLKVSVEGRVGEPGLFAEYNQRQLGFSADPRDEQAEICTGRAGLFVYGPYCLTRGSQDSRQISVRLPEATSYSLDFTLDIRETPTKTVSVWRATRVIPMETESRAGVPVRSGKSPEVPSGIADSKSVLTF
jgi:hypothetical protein